jgi:hypothetical protein
VAVALYVLKITEKLKLGNCHYNRTQISMKENNLLQETNQSTKQVLSTNGRKKKFPLKNLQFLLAWMVIKAGLSGYHVIRNAGGRASDISHSLLISAQAFKDNSGFVIHHWIVVQMPTEQIIR